MSLGFVLSIIASLVGVVFSSISASDAFVSNGRSGRWSGGGFDDFGGGGFGGGGFGGGFGGGGGGFGGGGASGGW